MRVESNTNARLSDLLATALAGDPVAHGFEVHYQPVVRFDDKATVALEALVRWWHPTIGRIDPEVFVVLAERTGLVQAVDNFVLERVCADFFALSAVYGAEVDLHVNVSASRLGEAEVELAVSSALQRYDVPASRLVLEITETSQIVSLSAARSAVLRLQALGLRVALDDLGAGYNTLLQLHCLPVDFVKLDAGLTHVMSDLECGAALCRSVMEISAALGVTVIAEGIERRAQADALARMGCRFGQGFLYGMPLRLRSPSVHRARAR